MAPRRLWSAWDDQYLLSRWPLYSASVIGRSLGVSRNAVIARYHRIIRHKFSSDLLPERNKRSYRKRAAERVAARTKENQRRQHVAKTLLGRGLSARAVAELMHLPVGRVYRALHASSPA